MPIRKRKSVPTIEATEASQYDEDETTARHPGLQGLRLDVYQFVADNPNSTRDDVSRGLSLKSSTATARVKELIDEGFLFEPIGVRKMNSSGVRAKCLHVTDRPQGGSPLDRVRIEVELTIDRNGVYGARATVHGGKPQHGPVTVIKRASYSLTAPHPDTYDSQANSKRIAHVSRMDTAQHMDDIIEGEAIPLDD